MISDVKSCTEIHQFRKFLFTSEFTSENKAATISETSWINSWINFVNSRSFTKCPKKINFWDVRLSWMVLFRSLLDQFVSCFVSVNKPINSQIWRSLIHELLSMNFMDWVLGTIILSFILRIQDSYRKFMLKLMMIVSILNFESRCSSSAADSMVGPNIVVLLLRFLLNSEYQVC